MRTNAKAGRCVVLDAVILAPYTVSPRVAGGDRGAYRVPNWDADPKSRGRVEGADLQARGRRRASGREARGETRRDHGADRYRRRQAFILTPKEIKPENRNRLLVHVHGGGYVYAPGEAGTGEGTLMAGLRRIQGHFVRLPHAAGPPLSGRDGRCHGRVEGRDPDAESAQHGDLRHVDRRRHDAGDDPARQTGRSAVAGRDRAGHAWSDLTETGDTYKTNDGSTTCW